MANPEQDAPVANSRINQKPKSKHAEKIAVNQRLPVESLLEDFIRQELSPDPNDGNNYYVGKVVQVIAENNKDIGIFDIFNDSVSNLERFYSNYKTQDKVITNQYVVHIPELFSTSRIDNGGNLLNYYTKFKINYSGKDSIKVNDLVKIIFKNTKNFADPQIIAVYKSNGDDNSEVDLKGKISQSLQSYNNCRVLQLEGSRAPNADLNSSFVSDPVAGYYQLFDTLDYVFSPAGFKNFSRQEGPKSTINIDNLKKIIYSIYCDSKVKEIGKNKNNLKNKFMDDGSATPKIIVGEDRSSFEVLVRLTFTDEKSLEKFSKYIEKQLSKFRFSINMSTIKKLETSILFYTDLSIDIQAAGLDINDASVDTYIQTSEKLKNGSISNNNSNTETPQTTQTTLRERATFDPCENVQQTVTDLYIPVKDLNRWHRGNKDGAFISFFFDSLSTTKIPFNYPIELAAPEDLLLEESLHISGELISSKSNNPFYSYEDLKKINNKFYSIPEKIKQQNSKSKQFVGINSNFNNGKDNFISKESLDNRISKLSDFLISLKELVRTNENIEDKDVLIIPINVLRAKKTNSSDTESRHYYGQAVDLVIYVQLNNDVYQIPPEYVYLYCLKVIESFKSGSEKQNSGFGVFIDEAYNHFEYLCFSSDEEKPSQVKSSLSDDERENGRLWINGGKEDELKKIDKLSINKKERALKDYILNKMKTAPVAKILRLL